MDLTSFLMAQTEIEQPGLFPFPFVPHLIFCIIATVFFIWRFVKDRQPYQIIFAVAIPVSLLLHTSANTGLLYYSVGVFELLAILIAFVTSIVCKKKAPETSENPVTETGDDVAEEKGE